jgi:conjugal transfer pilin signal peptidase TrbI
MWHSLVLSIFSGILGASLLFWLNPSPRIVTVNITGMVSHFVKAETQKKHSPEELKKRSQSFGAELEKTLKAITKKERFIVLPSEAVVDGAVDITERVQKQVQAALR